MCGDRRLIRLLTACYVRFTRSSLHDVERAATSTRSRNTTRHTEAAIANCRHEGPMTHTAGRRARHLPLRRCQSIPERKTMWENKQTRK